MSTFKHVCVCLYLVIKVNCSCDLKMVSFSFLWFPQTPLLPRCVQSTSTSLLYIMRLQTLTVRLFLCFIGTSGSSSQPIFIQTNKDLQLTVPEGGQIGEEFYWAFYKNSLSQLDGQRSRKDQNYNDRVDFFQHNLSLILKSVQLSDSGIYTAVVFRGRDVTLSSYDITVQAPVSPVSVKVDSVSFSPESCNFTVSCTTELSPSISRSFTCDRHTCEEASPAPSDPAPSLHLFLSDVSIVCNHSNHVSWRNDTKDKRQVCPFGTEGSAEKLKGTAGIGGTVGGTVSILCFLCFIVGVVFCRCPLDLLAETLFPRRV